MSICLFGSVLACGTNDGYVYVHAVPTLKRLQVITHYKPLYSAKLCNEAILRVSITDSSLGPVLAAATKHEVHLVKWTPNHWIKSDDKKSVEVITLD